MKLVINYFVLLCVFLSCAGCDFILKIVHRPMAQEKQIFGDITEYNSKVEEVQVILKEIGYSPGAIDGKLGSNTRGAVEAFQKDYGLKTSGYIDKKTWQELNIINSANVISLNEVDMKQIQLALKNAGFDPGHIDGKKGDKTKEAIKGFQEAQGLKADGLIGSKTWQKLRKYLFIKIN